MKKLMLLMIAVSIAGFCGLAQAKSTGPVMTAKSDPSATRQALEGLTLHQHSGTVSSYDHKAGSLVIKNRKGEYSLAVNADTQIKRGRERLDPEELKPGMNVTVRYWEKEGKKIARIVQLPKN